jgi:hypothetical protein
MRDYAVDDYGLLLTEETLKTIASIACEDFYNLEDGEYGDALYDEGLCEYIGDFTGESIHIDDNGYDDNWKNGEDYSGDRIFYMPAGLCPTLFKAAYKSVDELINEFKSKLGEYLPDDFDYRAHIRHIVGTYYG